MNGVDDVEKALLQAYELIESTVAEHRRTLSNDILATGSFDGPAGENLVRELITDARHGLSMTMPADSAVAAAACAALASGGGPRFPVRILCSPRAIDRVPVPETGSRDPNWEVRVSDGPMNDAVVADGKAALVRSDSATGHGEVSIIQAPAVARAMESLFAAAWLNGVPLADYRALGDRESIRRILAQLCAGATDELAAQRLDVSLRTYRRRVAEIMRWLGASSRFQAGVRAAELGLLASDPNASGRST